MISKPVTAILAVGILALGGFATWSNLQAPKPPITGMSPDRGEKETGADSTELVIVRVPELTGAEKIGELAYIAKCADCHGLNAAGQEGIAPPLVHQIYQPSHHGFNAFLRAAQSGVISHHWPFGNMPPIEGLTTGDIRNIVAYIRALQKENGIF